MDLFLSCLSGCVGVCCFCCWYKDNQAADALPDFKRVDCLCCANLNATACVIMSFNEVNWLAFARISV